MIRQRNYLVGGHSFAIEYPDGMLSEKELPHYAPFQTESSCNEGMLFTLRLTAVPDDKPSNNPQTLKLEDEDGNSHCILHFSSDFSQATARIGGSESERRFALDSALMLMYAFASAPYQTLLVHASAIECNGRAYIFLGKSGTGKSTHSRLWIEHIHGTELLNDDNPIVRIIGGKAYVYGSPWSGKTHCYRNRRLPLAGIVRLSKTPKNRITPLAGIRAYAALLPSCSGMKWNHDMAEGIHATISHLIETVPVFSLECRPDMEAAILCYRNVAATHGRCVLTPSETRTT